MEEQRGAAHLRDGRLGSTGDGGVAVLDAGRPGVTVEHGEADPIGHVVGDDDAASDVALDAERALGGVRGEVPLGDGAHEPEQRHGGDARRDDLPGQAQRGQSGDEADQRAAGQHEEHEVDRDGLDDTEDEGEADGAGVGASEGKEGHEDAVFMRSYIPRTLNEVFDPERDVEVLSRGDGAQLIYKDTIGIVGPGEGRKGEKGAVPEPVLTSAKSQPGGAPKKGVTFADEAEGAVENAGEDGGEGWEDEDGGSEEEEEESGDGEEDEEGGEGFKEKKPRGHRHEDKEAKKVRS